MTINIDHPKGIEDVNTAMGLNIVPANGDCAPEEGFTLEFVYGAVYQGSTPPSLGEAQSGDVSNPATGTFNFPSGLEGAVCNAAAMEERPTNMAATQRCASMVMSARLIPEVKPGR